MSLTIVYIEEVAIVGVTIIAIVVFLDWFLHRHESVSTGERSFEFRRFQRKYLVGYLTATMGDWLQGPYIYALYASYGFSTQVSLSLFIAGVCSSAMLGAYLGLQADRHGRRAFAMVYCILYSISCLAKHFNIYSVLFFGDALAGLAISLLYCVFDAWLVSEHNSRGFDEHLLKETFSTAFCCNSLVAILAGEIGEAVADLHDLVPISSSIFVAGYSAPFDVAMVFLAICAAVLYLTWPENKSESFNDASDSTFISAALLVWEEPQILTCGTVCALFEGSMFIFVVNWSPALQEKGVADPPFGHVFSLFMLMIMLGTRIFSLASSFFKVEYVGLMSLLLAVGSHSIVVFATSVRMRFLSFLLFEASVGMYFPMIGSLKGRIVPEDHRSTIYGLFRIPLNASILFTLLLISDVKICFGFTSMLLMIATCALLRLCFFLRAGDNARGFQVVPSHDIQNVSNMLDGTALDGERLPPTTPTRASDVQLAIFGKNSMVEDDL